MGISYKNGSGYSDPTAFQAVANIERDERTLRIVYPSGSLSLYINEFFPCSVERARKIFRLMRQYSSRSDMERLHRHLLMQVQRFGDQMKSYAAQATNAPNATERNRYTAEFKRAQTMKRRAERNIEMLQEVMK